LPERDLPAEVVVLGYVLFLEDFAQKWLCGVFIRRSVTFQKDLVPAELRRCC
jgi:hypothetical protein